MSLRLKLMFVLAMFVFLPSFSYALDVEGDYETKIDQIFTYNSLSNGDVVLYITVTNDYGLNLTCTTGVYMKKDDIGMKHALSVALAARASNANVHIQADKDTASRWSGDNNICHLVGIKY